MGCDRVIAWITSSYASFPSSSESRIFFIDLQVARQLRDKITSYHKPTYISSLAIMLIDIFLFLFAALVVFFQRGSIQNSIGGWTSLTIGHDSTNNGNGITVIEELGKGMSQGLGGGRQGYSREPSHESPPVDWSIVCEKTPSLCEARDYQSDGRLWNVEGVVSIEEKLLEAERQKIACKSSQ